MPTFAAHTPNGPCSINGHRPDGFQGIALKGELPPEVPQVFLIKLQHIEVNGGRLMPMTKSQTPLSEGNARAQDLRESIRKRLKAHDDAVASGKSSADRPLTTKDKSD